MNNKNNTKKKVIITILALVLVAVGVLFALKGCQKEEPVVHTHSYKINEEGTWICSDDNDILSNTDKPYVAILEDNQPKDILAIDSLSKTKSSLGNGTIYKDGNNIYYSGNNAQTIIIKTEKVDDKQKDKDNIVINAPNDTVYHYGSSTVISLDAIATNSFHESGDTDLITLTKGRVVLENKSDVKEIYLDINNENYSYETTIIALKEEATLPRLTRDAVNLEEGEVKTLAIVQRLKDEVKTETNAETNEVIETVLEVQAGNDDYVKIENVRKSDDELIIEAFLSPNAKEDDKTKTDNQSTSTITLEEAKEGSTHEASKNVFVSKEEKVIEVVKPTETKEEQKQEETKPVVTPAKKEETKPEVTPTQEDTPSTPTHTHSYGNWYDLDDTYHAKKCSCGDTVKEAHDLDADGVCQKCGHNAVAKIGNVYYKTLEAAVEAVTDNSTIVILENIIVDNSNVIDKNITLELNGKNITTVDDNWKGVSPTKQGIFYVKSGATFTINGTGEISTENENVYGAIVLTIGGDASNNDSSNPAKLVVNGGTLKGYYYGVSTNGNRHNTEITINGGTLTGYNSANATSIYHPNRGELTINNGTFIGYDGIAIKGGTPVTINGGTFIATGTKVVPTKAADSGCNNVGSALYVEGNYGYGANVVVNGGTFKVTDPSAPAVLSMFNTATEATIELKGGVYDNDPSEYTAVGYAAIENKPENDKYTVELFFAGGDGTEEKPFLVANKEQFLKIESSNSDMLYYKLQSDIALEEEFVYVDEEEESYYIDSLKNVCIDGGQHIISTRHYSYFDGDDPFIFGILSGHVILKDLTVCNGMAIVYEIEPETNDDLTEFINVNTIGTTSGADNNNPARYVAYLVSSKTRNINFINCDIYSNVIGSGFVGGYIGGFYWNKGDTNLSFVDCDNYGNLISTGTSAASMFISNPTNYGSNLNLTITNCSNNGKIIYSGDIIGTYAFALGGDYSPTKTTINNTNLNSVLKDIDGIKNQADAINSIANVQGSKPFKSMTGDLTTENDCFVLPKVDGASRYELLFSFTGRDGANAGYKFMFDNELPSDIKDSEWINYSETDGNLEEHNKYNCTYYTYNGNYVYNDPGASIGSNVSTTFIAYDAEDDIIGIFTYKYSK